MFNLGSFLTGFGFKFRNLVNLAASGYALATILPFFGFGESGFANLTKAAKGIQLTSLGDWIQSIYRALGSGTPSTPLLIVLTSWLIVVCLSLKSDYEEKTPTNGMLNSAIASAFIWALWADLVSPGSILNLAVVAIAITLIAITPVKAGINTLNNEEHSFKERITEKDGWHSASLAFLGILLSFVYVVIAPPIWMAGPNQTGQTDFERGFNTGRAVSARSD